MEDTAGAYFTFYGDEDTYIIREEFGSDVIDYYIDKETLLVLHTEIYTEILNTIQTSDFDYAVYNAEIDPAIVTLSIPDWDEFFNDKNLTTPDI